MNKLWQKWFGAMVILGTFGTISTTMAQSGTLLGQASSSTTVNKIPGQYIVVLKDSIQDVDRTAADIARRMNGTLGYIYYAALKGFVLQNPNETLLAQWATDSRILFVSPDQNFSILTAISAEVPTGVRRIQANLNPTTALPGGIGIAVIDTGIQLTHPDLVVKSNVSFVKGYTSGNDDNGHGTLVAGVIGAKKNGVGVLGVLPSANLHAVKVLDRLGVGAFSNVIKGIDYITQNKDQIAIANMSMVAAGTDDGNCGMTNYDALHKAICGSTAAGVIYVVAAGNNHQDAKNFIPASYDEVITVSALADTDGKPNGLGWPTVFYGPDDSLASFSNFGADIDLIAPGANIKSTFWSSGYASFSGTSLAAPHVVGTIALWIIRHGKPISSNGLPTGSAKDPAIRSLINQISEPIGPILNDPDGISERMVNANTQATGGTGTSVCCAAH